MKNKLCYTFLGILMCFSFLINVHADSITFAAEASKNNVVEGEEITVTVNVTSNNPIKNCTIEISNNDSIKYKENSIGTKNDFISTIDGSNITVSSEEGKTAENGLEILEFKYTVYESGTITIFPKQCTIKGEAEDTELDAFNAIEIKIDAAPASNNDDTTLSEIKVDHGGDLLEEFNPNNKEVMIGLESPNFGLILTANNTEYQDDILVKDDNGTQYDDFSNITWNSPTNQQMRLYVYVNGKNMYELLIIYEEEGLDNSLKFLTINGKEVPLEEGKDKYVVTVPNDTTHITFDAELKQSENFEITTVTIPGTLTMTGDIMYLDIQVKPKSTTIGAESILYAIEIVREPGSGTGNQEPKPEVPDNPGTGDVSMFVMLIVLISSLTGSIILYQKNLEGYK